MARLITEPTGPGLFSHARGIDEGFVLRWHREITRSFSTVS